MVDDRTKIVSKWIGAFFFCRLGLRSDTRPYNFWNVVLSKSLNRPNHSDLSVLFVDTVPPHSARTHSPKNECDFMEFAHSTCRHQLIRAKVCLSREMSEVFLAQFVAHRHNRDACENGLHKHRASSFVSINKSWTASSRCRGTVRTHDVDFIQRHFARSFRKLLSQVNFLCDSRLQEQQTFSAACALSFAFFFLRDEIKVEALVMREAECDVHE